MAKKFMTRVGMDYTPDGSETSKRVEAGEIVTDLPDKSVGWLTKHGYIEEPEGDMRTTEVKERSEEIADAHQDSVRQTTESGHLRGPGKITVESPDVAALDSLDQGGEE